MRVMSSGFSEQPKLDKETLIKEAAELAAELARERVPRLNPGSTSTDQVGISRTHLKPFVTQLTRTQDLDAFRRLLAAAPGIDRAVGQNQKDPLAYHSTVAKILAAIMNEHPQRDAATWLWILSWTARLLLAEEAEGKEAKRSDGEQEGSSHREQHHQDKSANFGNGLAKGLQRLLGKARG